MRATLLTLVSSAAEIALSLQPSPASETSAFWSAAARTAPPTADAEDYRIDGVEGLELHHLYRTMAWLGEELPADQQDGAMPFAPRCVKDVVEEELFACRRDLLTRIDIAFMDTTSLYFEGAGGQTLGRRGFSKNHRLISTR